jgi:3-methyladenine DNA glycosylase/8-oxoguanine DNA glycosylase
VPLLPAPQPFSLQLTTARFRAFGLDRATVWKDGALYRAVGTREVRIAATEGGVEVEPLDAETEAVVGRLLGFDFDLVAFATWAATEELLAPVVARFTGFRPTLAPNPFEMLVGAITAQQVSLYAGPRDPQPTRRAFRRVPRPGLGVPTT